MKYMYLVIFYTIGIGMFLLSVFMAFVLHHKESQEEKFLHLIVILLSAILIVLTLIVDDK